MKKNAITLKQTLIKLDRSAITETEMDDIMDGFYEFMESLGLSATGNAKLAIAKKTEEFEEDEDQDEDMESYGEDEEEEEY